MLKILKFRVPTRLHDEIKLSQRNNGTLIILPTPSDDFIYKGSKLWNMAIKLIAKTDDLLSIKFNSFKCKLKKVLVSIQKKHDTCEWSPHNFKLDTAI